MFKVYDNMNVWFYFKFAEALCYSCICTSLAFSFISLAFSFILVLLYCLVALCSSYLMFLYPSRSFLCLPAYFYSLLVFLIISFLTQKNNSCASVKRFLILTRDAAVSTAIYCTQQLYLCAKVVLVFLSLYNFNKTVKQAVTKFSLKQRCWYEKA